MSNPNNLVYVPMYKRQSVKLLRFFIFNIHRRKVNRFFRCRNARENKGQKQNKFSIFFPTCLLIAGITHFPIAPCISVFCARATSALSLSVTRALPSARWWRSSVLAVRDAESVGEIQSYCLGSLCRTANARSASVRGCIRVPQEEPISSLGESSSSRRKGNRDAQRDGYVRVKGCDT